jgi:hypothetical protein
MKKQIDNFVSTTTLHVLNSKPQFHGSWYPSTTRMAPPPVVLQYVSMFEMGEAMGYNDEAARVMQR